MGPGEEGECLEGEVRVAVDEGNVLSDVLVCLCFCCKVLLCVKKGRSLVERERERRHTAIYIYTYVHCKLYIQSSRNHKVR